VLTIRYLLLALSLCLPSFAFAEDQPNENNVRQVWQILDYLSVDYAGAVKDGEILEASEYAEMQEFSTTARAKIAALPSHEQQSALLGEADALIAHIAARDTPAVVASSARGLAAHMLTVYPVKSQPPATIDLARAKTLYQENCMVCHGPTGRGDGPAAAQLAVPPIAFADATRAAQRSMFALQQIITQGIEGTPMISFRALPEADRWALAFYVGQFSYSQADRDAGEALWKKQPDFMNAVPDINALANLTELDLANRIGNDNSKPVLAYLRARPEALIQNTGNNLSLARQRLENSLTAYRAGNHEQARDLALSAYLDGVEPLEPTIATRDGEIRTQIETAMGLYRTLLTEGAPEAELAAQVQAINVIFDKGDELLSLSEADATTSFTGSLTILLREGLEALLMVVAMLAFLEKTARSEQTRYVHAGWLGALAAGVVTWLVATYFIGISGASRELTEGISSLFAAIVLLGVGMWMHRKSVAGRWHEYFNAKLSSTSQKRSTLALFSLSFIAVYREVFETILFYAALWQDGNHMAIVAGLGVGVAILLAVAVWMLRFSKRLPISQFFSVSSLLVAVLAVILIGKGIAGLQEAGILNIHSLPIPRLSLLGIFPTLESISAQILMLVAAIAGFYLNARPSAKVSKRE
jgi:high-affinity iron transporter